MCVRIRIFKILCKMLHKSINYPWWKDTIFIETWDDSTNNVKSKIFRWMLLLKKSLYLYFSIHLNSQSRDDFSFYKDQSEEKIMTWTKHAKEIDII